MKLTFDRKLKYDTAVQCSCIKRYLTVLVLIKKNILLYNKTFTPPPYPARYNTNKMEPTYLPPERYIICERPLWSATYKIKISKASTSSILVLYLPPQYT